LGRLGGFSIQSLNSDARQTLRLVAAESQGAKR
jgi:hypothetical protein